MPISQYRISDTHGNATTHSACRVYKDNIKICEVFINCHSPKQYLQQRNGKHKRNFVNQCLVAGLTQEEINSLLS